MMPSDHRVHYVATRKEVNGLAVGADEDRFGNDGLGPAYRFGCLHQFVSSG